MAKSLGLKLDEIETAIDAVLGSQSYEMNGRKLTRADLNSLYAREDRLISQIELHGRDFIPGQNTKPMKMSANVVFN